MCCVDFLFCPKELSDAMAASIQRQGSLAEISQHVVHGTRNDEAEESRSNLMVFVRARAGHRECSCLLRRRKQGQLLTTRRTMGAIVVAHFVFYSHYAYTEGAALPKRYVLCWSHGSAAA